MHKQNKMKTTIAALFALALVACNVNYEKTRSGLAYKIFHGKGDTIKPKAGQFAKYNIEYTLMDRDSVLQTTYGRIPVYNQVDTGRRADYSYMEVLSLMNEGDSAEISISIDSLKSKAIIPDYNPLFVKGQLIKCRLHLQKVFKDEKQMLDDYDKSMQAEKNSEVKSLEGYMAKNKLKGIKTKNGAYVVVENPGDQSQKADSGKLATVMYRGYLESNGKVFDTNMDSSKGHTDPIPVPVGNPRSNIIQGWHEGLPYFGKGGKGKILVPAMLGYGPQPQGADIPAFSNLIFDVEVIDVQDVPKAPEEGHDSTGHAPEGD